MISNYKIKELILGLVLVLTGFLSYQITNLFNEESSLIGYNFVFNIEWMTTFIITFVVLCVINLIIFRLIFSPFSNHYPNNSSRLLNWKQIKGEQRSIKNDVLITKKEKKFKTEKDTLLLSRNIKLNKDKVNEHTLVVAPTGGGKSASILIPQLYEVDDASVVVTDPKSELFKKTAEIMKSKGYVPILLKLDDPSKSIKYNLFDNCKTPEDVRKLSETILGDDEWGRLSQTLLQAFIFRRWKVGGTITDVVNDLAHSPVDIYELELEMFSEEEIGMDAKRAFNQFKKTAAGGSFVSSVFATIQSKMKVFEFANIQEISEGGTFKIEFLRQKKIILYISYPEEESNVYQPFLASFYYQMFSILKGDDSVNEFSVSKENMGLQVFF
jgi:type IV secretion system protein VirD4